MSEKRYEFNICNKDIEKTIKEVEVRINRKKSGVYRFIIMLDSGNDFKNDWNSYKAHMGKTNMSGLEIKEIVKKLEDKGRYSIKKIFDIRNVPAFNKSNNKNTKSLGEVTLYVGSAECLSSRIREHCIDDISKSGQTYSLKLSSFLKRNPDYEIKLIIEEFEKEKIKKIEGCYHDEFSPLLGSRDKRSKK